MPPPPPYTLSASLHAHRYPAFLLRHPCLIHWLHAWNRALLPRHRIIGRAIFASLRKLPPGAAVLDAGFGEGQHLYRACRAFPQLQFTGVDRNEEHIAFGKRYAAACLRTAPQLFIRELEELVGKGRFSLVICTATLQYTADDGQVLRRLLGATRQGGQLLLYVPVNNRRVLTRGWPSLFALRDYERVQQRRRIYSKALLFEKLEAAGWVVTDHRWAYGTLGIAAHEWYNAWLLLLGNAGHLAWPLLLLAPLVVLPALGLQALDSVLPKENGNGLLVVAKR